MISAWIVVREEKHVDDRFWVCLNKDDALQIARDVTAYCMGLYSEDERMKLDVDEELYGDSEAERLVFNCTVDDGFSVYVQPQQIREPGEVAPCD